MPHSIGGFPHENGGRLILFNNEVAIASTLSCGISKAAWIYQGYPINF
jgi:hypothetical protein